MAPDPPGTANVHTPSPQPSPSNPALLLHVCCAACLASPLKALREEGFEVRAYFHNPNIHPLLEFRKRAKALRTFQQCDPVQIDFDEEYGLETFLTQVRPLEPGRCGRCHALRLAATARHAAALGVAAFSSTLLVSQQQDHDSIRRAGDSAAAQTGVAFVYRDFRPLAQESRESAASRRLYIQNYCGCVFSEYERYRLTKRELPRDHRAPGGLARNTGRAAADAASAPARPASTQERPAP